MINRPYRSLRLHNRQRIEGTWHQKIEPNKNQAIMALKISRRLDRVYGKKLVRTEYERINRGA
jgi:hypothetical protein